MATLFEYYITGDNSYYMLNDATIRIAQTFTPSIAHKITSVKLKLFRYGSPGILTANIRATDGEGHPTGGSLCSGTINGNTITTNEGGAWYEITLGAGCNLDADTKYAIQLIAEVQESFNYVNWRNDTVDATYPGGCRETSVDSGSTWTSSPEKDLMFEEWGELPAVGRSFGFIIG